VKSYDPAYHDNKIYVTIRRFANHCTPSSKTSSIVPPRRLLPQSEKKDQFTKRPYFLQQSRASYITWKRSKHHGADVFVAISHATRRSATYCFSDMTFEKSTPPFANHFALEPIPCFCKHLENPGHSDRVSPIQTSILTNER